MPSDAFSDTPQGDTAGAVDLVVATMAFQAADAERLAAVLARYVVLARGAPGCRNIDLCSSAVRPGRFLIVEKWESRDAQRAHMDAEVTVEMARACEGILAAPPELDLLDAVSAHDLC